MDNAKTLSPAPSLTIIRERLAPTVVVIYQIIALLAFLAIPVFAYTWLRQPFLWQEIEPEPGNFNWAAYDPIVEAVAEFDGRLKLVALLDGSPEWARHRDAPDHPFAPPESPAQFGDFARAVAERYGDEIVFYQIWDEPNIEEHWGNLNPRPT